MKDIMLADTPVEQREQILRDSCDQIVERSYTRKFDTQQINERRAELANVAIQKADLEDEGMVGFYTPEGYLLEQRAMTQEERQRNVFRAIRTDRTGTND